MLCRVVFSAAVVTAALQAQRPEIGVRVGWPVISPYTVHDFEDSNRACQGQPHCGESESAGRTATLGLSVRMSLGGRIALRAMPSWQRIKFDYTALDRSSSYAQTTTADRWELPVITEWNIAGHVRPGLGAVVSMVSGEQSFSRLDVAPGFGTAEGYTNLFRVEALSRRTVAGFIADIEFPFRSRFATIAPDLRYTRWLSKHYGYRGRLDTLNIGLSLRF
jgi:hypothetical protein